MNIKKKVIAVFLVMSMLFSIAPMVIAEDISDTPSAAAESAEVKDSALEFFKYIIVKNKVEYAPDEYVNRAEYAAILSNMLGLTDSNTTTAKSDTVTKLYNDVDSNHVMYDEIKAAVNGGYMTGISDSVFAPEQNMTVLSVVKTMVDIMGYKLTAQQGTYPQGYQTTAESLGLLKGLGKNYNDEVTQKDVAKIIYNALDVEVQNIEFSGTNVKIEAKKNITFLTEVLKLDRIRGVLSDNGLTALNSETRVSENQVKIGDEIFELGEKAGYAKEYLGRNVVAYVTNDDEDDRALIYAAISGRDVALTFDSEDFVSFTPEKISYDKNGKTITKNIASNASLVLNNSYQMYFTEETFKNIEEGTITLILDGSSVRYIIAKSHEYMVVDRLQASDRTYYSKLKTADRTVEVLELEDYDFVNVFDENGNEIAEDQINVGSVLDIERSGKVIKITIINKTIDNFKVSRILNEDGHDYITDGTSKYRVSKKYMDSPYTEKPVLNGSYTLTMGSDDFVVWMEQKRVDKKEEIGFLIKSAYDEEAEAYSIKLYTTDGKIVKYNLKDKVKVTDQEGDTHRYSKEIVHTNYLYGYNGLIKIELNVDKLVSVITIPRRYPDNHYEIITSKDAAKKDGSLYTIFDRNKISGTGTGWVGDGGFNGLWFYNNNTKFINTPTDLTDESKYQIVGMSDAIVMFESNRSRKCMAYSTRPNSTVADYVVFYNETEEAAFVGGDRLFVVVDNIEEILDADDNVIERLTGTQVSEATVKTKRVTFYSKEIDDAGTTHSSFKSIKNALHDNKADAERYDVQAGDILRLKVDVNNCVTVAELVYRPTLENPGSPNGKKGWLVGANYTNKVGQNNGNPFNVSSTGSLEGNNGTLWNADATIRIGFGSVISTEDKFVNFTTCDLTAPGRDLTSITEEYMVASAYLNNYVIVDYDGKNVTSKVGSIDDIKTFEQVGHNCSRILFMNHWGVYGSAVIINGGKY